MERVQFQQEQMLSELKDLAQKGVFSQGELKQIMKKRTAFETTLVRRVPRKGDFLRYAAYEMSLEALRKKRVERLKIPKGPASVSDYALVRRQFQIFERALKKFKEDVGLWVQYIHVAKREGARALVGRISARALSLHPNSPALYILAASHELNHLSHSAARILLQRGIRLNPESVDLWREYLKMELGFVESLRRRWEVLGLNTSQPEDGERDQSEDPKASTESRDEVGDDEKARKEILEGGLAKAVLSSAVKAKPSSDLFSSLHGVLVTYPCPNALRRRLLEHLHGLLGPSISLDTDPLAAKLHATWFLTPELLDGPDLVDAIKGANEELSERLRRSQDAAKGTLKGTTLVEMVDVYSKFVREWFEKDVDENLRLYLLASLQSLCSTCKAAPLLLAHLELLSSPLNPKPIPKEKLLKLARKYSNKASKSSNIWLFRLSLERSEKDEVWLASAKEARQAVPANADDDFARRAIWDWALDCKPSAPLHDRLKLTENLLAEASSAPFSKPLVDHLLVRYLRGLWESSNHEIGPGKGRREFQIKDINRIAKTYLPSSHVWNAAFEIYSTPSRSSPSTSLPPPPPTDSTIESRSPTSPSAMDVDHQETSEMEPVLQTIYNRWRLVSPLAQGEAALKWAQWLTNHSKGPEAAHVIATARAAEASLGQAAAEAFERRWREILDGAESEDDEEP